MKTWNSPKKQSKVQKGIVGTVILVILAGAVIAGPFGILIAA
jgi:ABC-type phosphate transport system permease subunit